MKRVVKGMKGRVIKLKITSGHPVIWTNRPNLLTPVFCSASILNQQSVIQPPPGSVQGRAARGEHSGIGTGLNTTLCSF